MTLEQLRIFVGVAEREHMTAAARALNVTQSAASAAIAALEERHAIKLFHRVGRGITLTEAGRLFLTEARGVLARAGAAENVLEEMGGLKRGTLRVVASQTIAAYWLPPILAAFHERHPAIGIELAIGNTEQAAAASTMARPTWHRRGRSTIRHWRTGRLARIGCCSSGPNRSASHASMQLGCRAHAGCSASRDRARARHWTATCSPWASIPPRSTWHW
jgi:DNA-binding transcriptional LysR family regulator